MNDITRFEKLTAPENGGEYKIESLKKTQEEILFLCNYCLKVTAQTAYFVGQRLVAMKEVLEHGKFTAWIEEEFPLSHRTANNYMRFYETTRFANFANLEGLTMTEALREAGIIEPKKTKEPGIEGYNRIDLGGDPGQMRLDFGELFDLPAVGNRALKNYRTVSDLISEIIVVRRCADGDLISKRFNTFHEDIPQDPQLRMAYKDMSYKTQEAIEDYLAVVEQKEENAGNK
jgi:hypothetical protein